MDAVTISNSEKANDGCQTLEQAADLHLYIKNTFRVTGLPVFASEKEIKKRADRQKMLDKLGHAEEGPDIAYPLLKPPSGDQISAAMQRLKNPELRMVDEFFWFLPETIEKPENDSAYQAILAGDQDTAFQIWSSKENSVTEGSIAKHNLAILFHLTALDWTNYQLGSDQIGEALPLLETEREDKIRGYWTNAISRWKAVSRDEKIEDYIKERIKVVNDPRLTTGFGRRFFGSLPTSLCRINADIALRFIGINKSRWAADHIQYMRDLEPSKLKRAKISAIALTSVSEQVRNYIKVSQEGIRNKPEEGLLKAEKLIKDVLPLKKKYDLFFNEDEHQKVDLFDEVAHAGNICIVAYQVKTSDDTSFVRILKDLLQFAGGPDIIDKINNNIKVGENNLIQRDLSETFRLIKDIRESKKIKINVKLADFKRLVIKKIADAAEKYGPFHEEVIDLYDACAWGLRSISIDGYNDESAYQTAHECIILAKSLAKEKELKTKLEEDIKTITQTLNRR